MAKEEAEEETKAEAAKVEHDETSQVAGVSKADPKNVPLALRLLYFLFFFFLPCTTADESATFVILNFSINEYNFLSFAMLSISLSNFLD